MFCVKDNQETLKQDIEDYVQDEDLRKAMNTVTIKEKDRGRIEVNTQFTTKKEHWMNGIITP